MNNPVITEIARKHSKSYAQIMLRWVVQNDMIVLPKSSKKERIEENAQIFDFELTEAEMRQLNNLNEDLRTCWNPTRVP